MSPIANKTPLQGHAVVNQFFEVNPMKLFFTASAFNANELAALSRQGILFGPNSNGNFFDLMKGFVFFMPQNRISVQTREGIIDIPKGAYIWIMETGADAAIYNCHDSLYSGPVRVKVNRKEMILAPGSEILLTRNRDANFETLNLANHLGYRHVCASDLGNGIKVFVSEFSIANGLANVPAIHQLLQSHDPVTKKKQLE